MSNDTYIKGNVVFNAKYRFMEHLFDRLESEFEDSAFEEGGIVVIDSRCWKRPSSACEYFKEEKGFDVSAATLNFWRKQGFIDSVKIPEMKLTLVNVNTLRHDVVARLEVERDEE